MDLIKHPTLDKSAKRIKWSKLSFLLTLLLSCFLLYPNVSISQDCAECKEALRKDVFKYTSNSLIYSKYMEQITEKEYNEFKTDISSSATIPVPEIADIITASFNYSDFKKRMHDFLSKTESENYNSEIKNYEVYRTEPVAYDNWTKCMLECIGKPGVFLIKSNDTERSCTYTVRYRGGVEMPETYYCVIEINSEGAKEVKNIILKRDGYASFTFNRKFNNNKSETLITLNAKKQRNSSSISFSDNSKTVFIKPAGITIKGLNYSYVTRLSKLEKGAIVTNCDVHIKIDQPMGGDKGGQRGFAATNDAKSVEVTQKQTLRFVEKYNKKLRKAGYSEFVNYFGCEGNAIGMSCDNKYPGYYHIIDIQPSSGYHFENVNNYLDMLKLEGDDRDWNGMQRCSQNDRILADRSDYKQLRVWLHKAVTAHLELTSYKDMTIFDTAHGNVDENGNISFKIPDERLNKYNIEIRLSDGSITNINESNVNDLAYLNKVSGQAIFTLKRKLL
ncbi:hypothetical protein [Pedobacter sp. WC2423]|uniref:hypothetical protein n=1 Tax=Pedobacter sp. WC2423 TaxID=3234142 RepID=UPI003466649F